MNRIFQKQKLDIGQDITLDSEASKHLITVLRMKPGEKIVLFNGEGGEFVAELTHAHKNKAQARVEVFVDVEREPKLKIHLGQCLSRGERMDYAIQKSVECGVTEITPLVSSRCNLRLNQERSDKRMEHWYRVIISACQQSGRTKIPLLHAPMSLEDWVAKSLGTSFVCDTDAVAAPLMIPIGSIANVLIGPEGGLTSDEIQFAKQHQFQSLSLGPTILRTETAAIAAIIKLQTLLS